MESNYFMQELLLTYMLICFLLLCYFCEEN